MNKKILIPLFVILVCGTVAYLFLYNSSQKNNTTDEIKQNSIDKIEIGENYAVNENNEARTVFLDVSNKTKYEVAQFFFDLINKNEINSISEKITFLQLTEKNNLNINLENFVSAFGLKMNNNVKSTIQQDVFSIVNCPNKEKSYSLALMLNMIASNDKQDITKNAIKYMRNWETTITEDMAGLFFSGSNQIDLMVLNKPAKFNDGVYRYAIINLPNNKNSELNYEIENNFIIISNSKQCIDKIKKISLPE